MSKKFFYLTWVGILLFCALSIYLLCHERNQREKGYQAEEQELQKEEASGWLQIEEGEQETQEKVSFVEVSDDTCKYQLGHWQEVPVDEVFRIENGGIDRDEIFSFHLSTQRAFITENRKRAFTLSEGEGCSLSTCFYFVPRTPPEIKEVVKGFKIKMMISPECLMANNIFNQKELFFWFNKKEEFSGVGYCRLREGLDFVIVGENAEDYDGEYIPSMELTFVEDYFTESQSNRSASSSFKWLNPRYSVLFDLKSTRGSICSEAYEICATNSEGLDTGFSLADNDDLGHMSYDDSIALQGVVVDGKFFKTRNAYDAYLGEPFAAIFSADPKKGFLKVFQSKEVSFIDKDGKEITIKDYFEEYDKLLQKYVREVLAKK